VKLLGQLNDRYLFDSSGRLLAPARLAATMIRESAAADASESGAVSLCILFKGGRKPVGGARVSRDAEGASEIGLWFEPDLRRRGFGKEALTALIRLCFDRWNCRRVLGRCAEENRASRRLMEACGLRPLCTLEAEDDRGRPVRWLTYGLEAPGCP
jgi:RimJ/RimL family protein N-acetyltransferase